MNVLSILTVVVYGHGQNNICGGSRGSDHCACLTGSDVTGSHVAFPVLFSRISPYFPPVLFSLTLY